MTSQSRLHGTQRRRTAPGRGFDTSTRCRLSPSQIRRNKAAVRSVERPTTRPPSSFIGDPGSLDGKADISYDVGDDYLVHISRSVDSECLGKWTKFAFADLDLNAHGPLQTRLGAVNGPRRGNLIQAKPFEILTVPFCTRAAAAIGKRLCRKRTSACDGINVPSNRLCRFWIGSEKVVSGGLHRSTNPAGLVVIPSSGRSIDVPSDAETCLRGEGFDVALFVKVDSDPIRSADTKLRAGHACVAVEANWLQDALKARTIKINHQRARLPKELLSKLRHGHGARLFRGRSGGTQGWKQKSNYMERQPRTEHGLRLKLTPKMSAP